MHKAAWILLLLAGGASTSAVAADQRLQAWIEQQADFSYQRVLEAISPADGARGSVMASPSRSEPNYYFHWIRDAALVMREVWRARERNPSTAQLLLSEYALFSRSNQLTSNPSGRPDTLGLGEPKFNMDGSAYDAPWGRPQNDGPALRAITLMEYAHFLIDRGRTDLVRDLLYRGELPAETVIKADLEFVAHHWKDASFDLWEEVLGDHFYTRMAQRRAMVDGARLARRMNDSGAALFYEQQAQAISESLESFWSPSSFHILTTLNWAGGHTEKVSNLDVAVILAVNQAASPGWSFSPSDPRVMSTAVRLTEAFEQAYSVNSGKRDHEGQAMNPGIGRYTEDRYNGVGTDGLGNPWFLATHALAEYFLRLGAEIRSSGGVLITPESRTFLSRFASLEFAPGQSILTRGDGRFQALVDSLALHAEAWIRRSRQHTSSAGNQSEQFNRDNGYMQGARDLTWNYASFLSLFDSLHP